jgi:hypothetical protein
MGIHDRTRARLFLLTVIPGLLVTVLVLFALRESAQGD